jgi:tetratricopeptide (TPR) repeat protein
VLLATNAGPQEVSERRPKVDTEAMREAMSPQAEATERYASAASYAHFLRARLHHHQGEHRKALDELRLALATDDSNPYLMTELAEQHARLGELDRAEAALRKVIDRRPGYAPAQLLMGRVLYEANRFTRARAHLQRAIRLNPKEPDAYLVLAQLWLDQARPDEAVKVVEEFSAAVPGEPVGYRRLGMALAERGDNARAEKLLRKAVDRDPSDPELWSTLAQLDENAGRLDEAEDAYANALIRDPDSKDVLLSAGRLALRRNGLARAKAYFDRLLSLSKDPEATVKVAFSYLSMRRHKEAADVLDQARLNGTEEPRLHFYAGLVHERMHSWQKAADAFGAVPKEQVELSHEAAVHRAGCLSALGQHSRALELYKKAVEERSEDLTALQGYAMALDRAGQGGQAEQVLLKAVAERPAPELYEAAARLYDKQGKHTEAIALLSKGLAKRPRDEALLYALGAAYERGGEVQKSLEKMRAVLDINPDNANALNFIGYTLADKGIDNSEAERLVSRALELKPDQGAFLDSLGWVYFRRGDFGRAVEWLEKASAASPGEATIDEHLGDAYARVARQGDAAEAYRRALATLTDGDEQPKGQRAQLERKLKMLGMGASAR